METRKVQLTGGSTYTVSLPKQWANEHGIEAGARLCLSPHDDGSLVVRPDRGNTADRTTVRVSIDHRSRADTARTVRALYAVGFDAFRLRAGAPIDTDARRAIATAASKLIGLEVTEETETHMTLRSLLDAGDVSIRQTVIQLQLVALSMQRDATRALEEGNDDLATQVIERDDEADRLFGMVDRHFQRALTDLQEIDRLGLDRPSLFRYYTTGRNLERVADHAEKVATIATRIDDVPDAVTTDVLAFADRSLDVVEDAASVLLAGSDVDAAYGALTARDELLSDLESFDQRLYGEDVPDAYLLGLVLDSVKRTAEYGGNIAEMAIQEVSRETATVTEKRPPR